MANEAITNKELYKSGLNGIKQKDWLRCGEKLGLYCSTSGGRGSHAVIRNPEYDLDDTKGLITTVPKNLGKQMNRIIFKQILSFGIKENEIWISLGVLKK